MALARSMASGLRSSGTKGPNTGVPRPATNSSAAFFCSGVIFSAGISGMRSDSGADAGLAAVWAWSVDVPAASAQALPTLVPMNSLRDIRIAFSYVHRMNAGNCLMLWWLPQFPSRCIFLRRSFTQIREDLGRESTRKNESMDSAARNFFQNMFSPCLGDSVADVLFFAGARFRPEITRLYGIIECCRIAHIEDGSCVYRFARPPGRP